MAKHRFGSFVSVGLLVGLIAGAFIGSGIVWGFCADETRAEHWIPQLLTAATVLLSVVYATSQFKDRLKFDREQFEKELQARSEITALQRAYDGLIVAVQFVGYLHRAGGGQFVDKAKWLGELLFSIAATAPYLSKVEIGVADGLQKAAVNAFATWTNSATQGRKPLSEEFRKEATSWADVLEKRLAPAGALSKGERGNAFDALWDR
jgi:hypothetical protein